MTPADGVWGGVQDDGTVNGLIGMVARHEAQLSMACVGITGKLSEYRVSQ